LLARYFVTLQADQIDTRANVIARLKEFQRTLGYNDSHLNAKGLYDSTKIEPDLHEGDEWIEEDEWGIPAHWQRYKENRVIEEKDESRIKGLQTRAEADLCERIKAEFETICIRLNGKAIDELPAVLEEYIAGAAPAPRSVAALSGKSVALAPRSSEGVRDDRGTGARLGGNHSSAAGGGKRAAAPRPLSPPQVRADTITVKGQTASIVDILSRLDITKITKASLQNQIYTSFRDLDDADRELLYRQALPLINAKLAEFGINPIE
jgi:hypothetical protein